ncbi:GNAT family N-acetyltransferase [uncultured Pseudokineococcus sp.]|uniref:GNAT family N-acetyltransferase n=1 Tax=uncultured Pseudokineococcus sp. TaxID=1642928 RepID=UPI002613E51E|nr:GNAT family N-acetyltransferase [uncultured Pseudokineococcus sp.]
MLRTGARVLDDADRDELLELCDRDPVANVFVAGRVEAAGLSPRRLGGEVWGLGSPGRLEAACWSGANLVPVEADERAVDAFAARARQQGRRCSSIVGPADAALGLWERLTPSWGRAREVRRCQPLLVLDGPPAVAPDPLVRRSRSEDLDVLVPACVAMFTEEVGYSPVAWDGGRAYRARVAELVAAGRSFLRLDAGEGSALHPVVDGEPLPTPRRVRTAFKAELGAVSSRAVQVQGVYVDPALRGQGLAAPGTAAVVALARQASPVAVSLYVNDFNTAAVAAYRRAGFSRAGTLATVLF